MNIGTSLKSYVTTFAAMAGLSHDNYCSNMERNAFCIILINSFDIILHILYINNESL